MVDVTDDSSWYYSESAPASQTANSSGWWETLSTTAKKAADAYNDITIAQAQQKVALTRTETDKIKAQTEQQLAINQNENAKNAGKYNLGSQVTGIQTAVGPNLAPFVYPALIIGALFIVYKLVK